MTAPTYAELKDATERAADRLDTLTYSMALKVRPEIHLEGLRGAISEIRDELLAALAPAPKEGA